MSDALLNKLNEIKAQKNNYITPENLKPGINVFNITSNMTNHGDLNIIPNTVGGSYNAGYVNSINISAVTSSIDSNITQANIKAGVTILGVEGNLEPDKPDQTKTVNPSILPQLIEPDTGYELASVTINAVTSSIDSNITPENIANGVNILGVTGNLSVSEDLSNELNAQNLVIANLENQVNDLSNSLNNASMGNFNISELNKAQVYDLVKSDDGNNFSFGIMSIPINGQPYTGGALCPNMYSSSNVYQNMFKGITTVTNFNTSNVVNMSDMFHRFDNLTTIPNFDTSNVTNMSNMFCDCIKLSTIPNFNTGKVTNMFSMFYDCFNLTNVPNFDTSNVTIMFNMFYFCKNLITVPNFNTNKVNYMDYMFYSCDNLVSVPNFNTSNVIRMTATFYGCNNLAEVPNFDMSNITSAGSTFAYCNKLTTIPNFDTSNVTNIGSMFFGCKNLINVPNFDTSNVTYTRSTFDGCSNLTTIPNFNLINVTNATYMFGSCINLTDIPEFNISNATNIGSMFYNCNNLSDASIQNIVNMCLNATRVTNKYINNTVEYSPFYGSNVTKYRFENRWEELTAAGWRY